MMRLTVKTPQNYASLRHVRTHSFQYHCMIDVLLISLVNFRLRTIVTFGLVRNETVNNRSGKSLFEKEQHLFFVTKCSCGPRVSCILGKKRKEITL